MVETVYVQRTKISNIQGRLEVPVYFAIIPVPYHILEASKKADANSHTRHGIIKAMDSHAGSADVGIIADNVLLQRLSLELVATYNPKHTKQIAEAVIKDYGLDYVVENSQK